MHPTHLTHPVVSMLIIFVRFDSSCVFKISKMVGKGDG